MSQVTECLQEDVVKEERKQFPEDGEFVDYFCNAVRKGDLEEVNKLIPVAESPVQDQGLIEACALGYREIVNELLKAGWANPAASDNSAIRLAVGNRQRKICKLLLKDVRVDPTACENEAWRVAVVCGEWKIIQLMLQHRLILVDQVEYFGLPIAAKLGHARLVKVLLEDGRFDPTKPVNRVGLNMATENGNLEIVELYLNDARMANEKCHELLIIAGKYGHAHILRYLLNKLTTIPEEVMHDTLIGAITCGNLESTKVIAEDRRAILNNNDNLPLQIAAKRNHQRIVKYLLTMVDRGVDPAACNLVEIVESGHVQILEMLMKSRKESSTPFLAGNLALNRAINKSLNAPDLSLRKRSEVMIRILIRNVGVQKTYKYEQLPQRVRIEYEQLLTKSVKAAHVSKGMITSSYFDTLPFELVIEIVALAFGRDLVVKSIHNIYDQALVRLVNIHQKE